MGRAYTNRFADALWRWRKVKTQTDTVGTSIEKEFLAENTQLTTNLISRKLDELEKIVKQGKVFYTKGTLELMVMLFSNPKPLKALFLFMIN